ncbi:pilus assembly protein [Candidimonas sp. SYP-B2681]|uniref:TadE family protein n=1 Tax=Candidimonas sp. SYP-B2681 TaxID=2497686 RepID=UPI000F8894EC|nr:TadE family protein [Candidimonas sp. SYP-B2681]RTZ45354.1 pilus assembly protein [Candidimonas sp. SYP-B2681]
MESRTNDSLLRSSRGSAALEAAIILPLFIFFLLGTIDLYLHFRAQSQVDRAASSVAHSLSMQREIFSEPDCAASNAICVYETIAADLYQPLRFSKDGRLTITVLVGGQDQHTSAVRWEAGDGWPVDYGNTSIGPARLGSADSLPPPRAGDTVILVEAMYRHEPFALSSGFWKTLGGDLTLYSRAVARPRYGDLSSLEPADD